MQAGDSIRADFIARAVAPLTRVARSARRRAIFGALSIWMAAAIGLIAVQFIIDKLLVLGLGPRWILSLVVVGVSLRLFKNRVWWAFAAKPGPLHVVAVLERRHPHLHDRLISAVAFAGSDQLPVNTSPALAAELMREAKRDVDSLDPSEVFNRPRLQKSLAVGALALLAVVTFTTLARPTAAAFVSRNWLLRNVSWPTNVRMTLEGFADGAMRWPIGDDLTLTATAEGVIPPGVALEITSSDGKTRVREMSLRGDRQFVLDYGTLDESFRTRLLIRRFGADESTDWYTVVGVVRPSIKSVQMEVTPPIYAGLERFTLPAGQAAAEILRGSRVRILATSNKPIRTAVLKGSSNVAIETTITDRHELSAEFEPMQSGNYAFDLLDEDQLSDLRPVTYALRLVNDPPPKVKLILPGAGDAVVPNAVLDLQVQADDNLGLRDIHLVSQIIQSESASSQPAEAGSIDRAESRPSIDPLPGLDPRQTRYEIRHTLPLMPNSLKPGDQFTLLVEARDYQPDSAASAPATTTSAEAPAPTSPQLNTNTGRSASHTLRIVSAEELLAELGRRESEWRREFELLIKSQEQIRDRVMNLNDEAKAQAGSTQFSARYLSEQRAQRQIGVRMQTVRRQFEQILAELKTNQLDSPAVRRRLDNGVIGPTGRLISTDIPAVSDLLGQASAAANPQIADTIERGHTAILDAMYSVLSNMLKWEGYNEAVTLLRDIIRLHGDVTRQTQSQLEAEIDRLLGGGATSRPADGVKPMENR